MREVYNRENKLVGQITSVSFGGNKAESTEAPLISVRSTSVLLTVTWCRGGDRWRIRDKGEHKVWGRGMAR